MNQNQSEWKTLPLPEIATDSNTYSLAKQLASHPRIRQLAKEKGFNGTVLKENAYRFDRWLKATEACQTCKGLSYCQNKPVGYRMGLEYDGILTETLDSCGFQREKEKSEQHLKQYRINDLSPLFYTLSFSDLNLENETDSYVDALMEAKTCFNQGVGVRLYGNMGTGKTYLSACACNDMAKAGHTVAFVFYPSFCLKLSRMSYQEELNSYVQLAQSVEFLVLDDIGAERMNALNRSILLSILDYRMQHHKTTWFTTNGDDEQLRQHFSLDEHILEANRIMERIQALAKPIYLSGNDRRHLFTIEQG